MKLRGRDEIITAEHKPGDLVFLGLYTSKACNLNCLYCFEDAGKASENETSVEEKIDVIDQGIELGAKVLFIAGSGEPTIDPQFGELINYASQNNLTTLLYTNGINITEALASELFEQDVTPIIKIESLDATVHDYLVGKKGSLDKAIQGIHNLFAAGYGRIETGFTRIGAASVYLKQNLNGLKQLHNWCEERNILHMTDWMSTAGRAQYHKEELIPSVQEIFAARTSMNESAGNVKEGNCLFWRYGLTVDNIGYVRPCTERATTDIGNIRETPLSTLNERKNEAYPKQVGCYTCIFKDGAYR